MNFKKTWIKFILSVHNQKKINHNRRSITETLSKDKYSKWQSLFGNYIFIFDHPEYPWNICHRTLRKQYSIIINAVCKITSFVSLNPSCVLILLEKFFDKLLFLFQSHMDLTFAVTKSTLINVNNVRHLNLYDLNFL